MSVADRVAESLRHICEKDYESAVIAVCIALDATAREEFPHLSTNKDTGKRCEEFVKANLDIITAVGFGGGILAAPGSTVCLKTPGKSELLSDLASIIYRTLRCTLIHEAKLPGGVLFTEESFYGERDGHFYIPVNMIYALLLAIVGAQSNGRCRIADDVSLNILGHPVSLNSLWGRADTVRQLLGIRS